MYVQTFSTVKADTQTRTHTAASALLSATKVLSYNQYRQKLCLENGSTTVKFYIAYAAQGVTPSVSTTQYTFVLNPSDYFEDTVWVGEIHAIANVTSSDTLNITELF